MHVDITGEGGFHGLAAQHIAYLKRSIVDAVCVMKEEVSLTGQFNPNRLRSGIISLRGQRNRQGFGWMWMASSVALVTW